ncbi:ankyrin repeat domain-containing protein [Streptomyces sp. NPDC088106]|uniref:ankyrin repeat domain-containing protein n=1 Tax=unclassified Streptomyces TaxID=2593676 RepID=UPI003437730A
MTEPIETPDELPQAAKEGDMALVTRLLDAGVGVDATGREGRTALDLAIEAGHTDMVRLLLAAGADTAGHAGYYHDLTPLTHAARLGRTAVVEVLLDAGVPTGPQARIPYTPLLVAANDGRTATVDLLLDRGADIDDRSMRGKSALEWSACFGQVEAVLHLLGRGAEPTAKALRCARTSAKRNPERAEDYARVLAALRAAGAVDPEER